MSGPLQTVRLPDNSYDSFALLYDGTGFDRFSLSLAERAGEYLRPAAGRSVLDVACGTGSLLAHLAAGAGRVVGVDRSPGMIRRAAVKTKTARFLVGTMTALPLRGRFDLVLCLYDSLNYLLGDGELHRAFAEARRVAADGAVYHFDLNDREAYESIWGDEEPFEAETAEGRVVIRTSWDGESRIGVAEVEVTTGRGEERRRTVSKHLQRWHRPERIAELLAAAGWRRVRSEEIETFPGDDGVLSSGKMFWRAVAG